MDDFHDDAALVRFVEEVAQAEADEVTLILNGDIFDFLKMAYREKYSRYITEDISLWKLGRVLSSHPTVFEAWKRFLQLPHTRLVFVIGNHDPDLVWRGVQEKLHQVLDCSDPQKIIFTHAFNAEHFHAQHGNLIDPLFGFDHQKPIITHRGRKILNLPVGAHMSAQHLMTFKKRFHDQEVLYPQHEVIKKYPEYKREITRRTIINGIRVFIIDPILHFWDPMYYVPYFRILKHLLKYGFDGVHDDRFMDLEKLDNYFGGFPIYVLAHAHVRKDMRQDGRRYLMVDCWRTERDVRTEDLRKKPKTYVAIVITDDKLQEADLKEFVLQ